MPLVLTLGRQRHTDLCEFKTSVVCRVSSRPAGALGRSCLKKTTTTTKKKSAYRKPNVSSPQPFISSSAFKAFQLVDISFGKSECWNFLAIAFSVINKTQFWILGQRFSSRGAKYCFSPTSSQNWVLQQVLTEDPFL